MCRPSTMTGQMFMAVSEAFQGFLHMPQPGPRIHSESASQTIVMGWKAVQVVVRISLSGIGM